MNKSIFSQLPNDLIMKIIREADGGRNTHKKKMWIITRQVTDKTDAFTKITMTNGTRIRRPMSWSKRIEEVRLIIRQHEASAARHGQTLADRVRLYHERVG